MAERLVNIEQAEEATALFGSMDANVRLIEEACGVSVVLRGTDIKLTGEEPNVARAARVVESLRGLLRAGETLNEQNIRYCIRLVEEDHEDAIAHLGEDVVCITAKGRPVKAKTLGQKRYLDAIRGNTITFGVGPAGTGKTYLAVAVAVRAFKAHEINRIVLTRPAVEAGEKLGFLPGDLQNKVDPYLRPLYDALFDLLGAETYQRHLERGSIEVAPLAYMRGRTLDDSFIILDEAQNTTPEQMKMLLTRLGQNSKAVITGDVTQIDLQDKKSGLIEATRILKGIRDIETVWLTEKDVVRHHLIQEIIKAYESYYEKNVREAARPPHAAKKRDGRWQR